QAAGIQSLQRVTGSGVQLGPDLEEQCLVRDLLDEEVAEAVRWVREEALLAQQLESNQFSEVVGQRGVLRREGLEQRERKLASKDGGHLERTLEWVRQPVDAGREQVVHRVRHLSRRWRAPQGQRAAARLEEVLLTQIAGQLLDKERVPLGPLEDERTEGRGQFSGVEERRDDLDGLLVRWAVEDQPVVRRAILPGRGGARPIVAEKEGPTAGKSIDEKPTERIQNTAQP